MCESWNRRRLLAISSARSATSGDVSASHGTKRVTIPPAKLRRDLGRDPEPGRGGARKRLRLAADAEQLGVLAVQAQHVLDAAELDAVVAVGDPALERLGRTAGRAQRGFEIVHDVSQLPQRPAPPLLDKAHNLYLQLT